MGQRWDLLQKFLDDKKSILVTTHLNPDGDGLGSEIALAHYLKGCGKKVHIINSDSLPALFEFLAVDVIIEQYQPDKHQHCV